MANEIAELKSELAKLRVEVSNMKLQHAEDRVFLKAMNGTVDSLSDMISTLDKQVVAMDRSYQAKAEQEQVQETKVKEMSMTEISQLYKKDPATARRAMEAQGMSPHVGQNPWVVVDVMAQKKIEESDPELAESLKRKAAHEKAASYR